ncbi:SRPBCC family protein [Streptomyces sp. NP160]|uniref:SRPBCC family protein n=1 Tax=Streptomyces sp. NP160 TaxID=2586637 RepID=UPI00111B5E6A|nr:SRPBCC family protein [Streptomyces sp. NP160]TNM59799.1 SRPBCC family protein [Streptomyces sp. NP160]
MASPQTYTVERSTVVAAAPDRIRAEVDDLHRWRAWSPFEGLDPALQRTYGGPASGPGATYAWSGNRKAGRGTMEVLESTPGAVRVSVVFEKPFPSTSTSTFSLVPEPAADGAPRTRVTWSMTGPRPLLLRVLGSVISMDKVLGKDFERGLQQLRAVAEAPPA